MITRFGSREICDVTFKAGPGGMVVNGHSFAAGQPIFVIDTATASSMEQATTTVYAQGGRGYTRLIAWEGEKTMTFNVTDALMSPLGLAILTGAGLADAGSGSNAKHIHVTMDKSVTTGGVVKVTLAELVEELGLPSSTTTVQICTDTNIKTYATKLDHNGAIVSWYDAVTVTKNTATSAASGGEAEFTITGATAGETVKLDFYVVLESGLTEIIIKPDSFGGFFYVEADTLYRNQDGKDMAATITFPKVKVQSGFTLSMSPTGDPSTFDFVMDAMPGYTYFDGATKVMCDISIVGGSNATSSQPVHSNAAHTPNP